MKGKVKQKTRDQQKTIGHDDQHVLGRVECSVHTQWLVQLTQDSCWLRCSYSIFLLFKTILISIPILEKLKIRKKYIYKQTCR